MTADEDDMLIGAFGTGEMVVTETAWYVRQVFRRHPVEALEYPIPEASIEMFVDGTSIPSRPKTAPVKC
ncbi:MAG TPA: hypothetical protein VGD71_23095 [Kribbella sp.]|jgi:hypothetical protein